jgi:hypothetical protein
MTKIDDLTAETVREILNYDPETGIFKWKWREDRAACWNTRYSGKVAGRVTSNSHGYMEIAINYRLYKTHRLAWLIVYGEWPPNDIDHKDGDKKNNRIANLRLATRQENIRNSGLRKNNRTGVSGVCWRKDCGKFRVRIKVSSKEIHLGYFDTFTEATAARHAAEIEYFGEFRKTV